MLSLLVQGPAIEPVTLDEIRTDLRLDNQDDLLLSSLITSARMVVEAHTGARMITQRWDIMFDTWPKQDVSVLRLLHWPVTDVEDIYILGDGRQQVDRNLYEVEVTSRIPQIILRKGSRWPALKRDKLGVLVSITAGFGDMITDIPEPLRQAIRFLVAHWYEERDWQGGTQSLKMPGMVTTLIQPYKLIKL